MIKYVETKIVFSEVPNEISLAISISGCPNLCEGCHSPYLREDKGTPLTEKELTRLLSANPGVSCVCLMGGDANPQEIENLARMVKKTTDVKVCWYSGRFPSKEGFPIDCLDYLKEGPFIREYGPLDSPTTNQKFFKISSLNGKVSMEDITWKFSKKIR